MCSYSKQYKNLLICPGADLGGFLFPETPFGKKQWKIVFWGKNFAKIHPIPRLICM